MAIVQFNRHFTQAQLTAAVGTSSIAGTAVVDGTWYIAKTGAKALYVGSIESGSTPTLKLIAQLNENPTGEQITNLINTYIASTQSPTLITKVDSAVKDGSGNTITSTYLDKTASSSQTVNGPIVFDDDVTALSGLSTDVINSHSENGISFNDNINLNGNSIVGENGRPIIGDETANDGVIIGDPDLIITLSSTSAIRHFDDTNTYKILDSGAQTLTDTEKTQVRTNIGAMSSTDVDNKINALDGTITKTAGSASASTAANAYQKVPVVSGFVLKEVDGKLVETNAASGPSTVTTVDVDAAGSAQKALNDAKDYADDLIEGLGTIMTFKGTYATEAALKSGATTPHKGDVYIVTADSSEWVYSGDTVDSTHPYDSSKWEKFGTTDVQGALYKGDNVFTNETLVVADGTAGKMKAVTDADVATRLADETAFTGKYKVLQTAVQDTAVAGKYISEIDQDTQGVITITRADLPSGSGSVGTASSDAGAWKTVVHDVSLSGHTLSGNTKSIPAATSSADGYMTSSQASTVDAAVTSVDGVSASSHSINAYASCSTAASTAAKTATITSGTTQNPLTAGTRVVVKFTYTNTANNPTLNINSSGAKNIFVNGAQITTGSNKGMLKGVCIFIYDGTQWHLIGGGSDYAAGDGLTLTDNTFSVNCNFGLMTDEVPGVLMVKTGEGNCLNGDDHSEYGPGIPEGSWKKPIIAQQNQGGSYYGPNLNDYNSSVEGELSVGSAYQSIPAATAAATAAASTDGYMTGQQAYNLALATACLTWEE